MHLLFVYGTLKRGCTNHGHLAAQTFLGEAHTLPGYRLFDLAGYPGMVVQPLDKNGVAGELWQVDEACLDRLDRFEGLAEGLYRREPLTLRPPFSSQATQAYLYARSVKGRRDLGSFWTE